MTDEYFTAVKHFDLSWEEVVAVSRMGLEHSFAPEDEKADLLESYDSDIAAFERRYSGDWTAPLADVEPETYTYGERVFGLSFD